MSNLHTPTAGGTYAVNHSLIGKFNMFVNRVAGEWVEGVIVSGKAKALLEYNERETGEEITVRQCLSTFTLVNRA